MTKQRNEINASRILMNRLLIFRTSKKRYVVNYNKNFELHTTPLSKKKLEIIKLAWSEATWSQRTNKLQSFREYPDVHAVILPVSLKNRIVAYFPTTI